MNELVERIGPKEGRPTIALGVGLYKSIGNRQEAVLPCFIIPL